MTKQTKSGSKLFKGPITIEDGLTGGILELDSNKNVVSTRTFTDAISAIPDSTDINNLSSAIDANDVDIAFLSGQIDTNSDNIQTNIDNISANDVDIAFLSGQIDTNTLSINDNTTNITSNSANILSNDVDIAFLSGQIDTNSADIATNTSDIASLSSQVGNIVLPSVTIIQGSVEDIASSTPGYIDSSDVVENTASVSGNIFYADIGTSTTNTSAWGDVLPLSIPSGTKRTRIKVDSLRVNPTAATDEDHATGVIYIDWDNNILNGFIMAEAGLGYDNQLCYVWNETLTPSASASYTTATQNGTYALNGDAPIIGIDDSGSPATIYRLPMVGKYRNVAFEITHE